MNGERNPQGPKLRPPPNQVLFQTARPWNIITPNVYRYEDDCWIDEFFESGRIRLSTISRFKTYADEVRGDELEAQALCYGESKQNLHISVFQQQGLTAAVLCCSHRLDGSLRDAFGRNSAFEITNTVGFSHEISRQLPGFVDGLEGSCIYRPQSIICRPIDFDADQMVDSQNNYDLQAILGMGSRLGGPELLLLKRKKYENQQEYRLLWMLDSIQGDYVDVLAPLARQYCRKVNNDEWSD